MNSIGLERARCYLLIQGIERSLGTTLLEQYPTTDSNFLTKTEADLALKRLREDLEESAWQISDVRTEDLLQYLDLGQLIDLTNRHIQWSKAISKENVDFLSMVLRDGAVVAIRKRVMHPVRPLEADDLRVLQGIAEKLLSTDSGFNWNPLREGLSLSRQAEALLTVRIPNYLAEESPVINNLPIAEFEDTGFIDREKERAELHSLLNGHQRVITITAEGGLGKTALALRICNDLVETQPTLFDRIIWVSLKTRFLTLQGMREVQEAINSVEKFMGHVQGIVANEVETEPQGWDGVLEQMESHRILFVIDNLETIGEQVRDLLLKVPSTSKVLMTSRVGLGEIEQRMALGALSGRDAEKLFRRLATVHSYNEMRKLPRDQVLAYCSKLAYSPLLIKWFVHAVGNGADVGTVLSKQSMDAVLEFCYANVYDTLSSLSKKALSALLASRRALTTAQLQELISSEYVPFVETCQELLRCSMLRREIDEHDVAWLSVDGLVYQYLASHAPPDNKTVTRIRRQLRDWQSEQQTSAIQFATYRYTKSNIVIENPDHRVAARHLRQALQASEGGDRQAAESSLQRAEQLTPTWWETFRVKAAVLERLEYPIYQVEQAYEQSLRLADNDVNHFFYATYLLRNNEAERAIEKIDQALRHSEALPNSLHSLRGRALLRIGRLDEAIDELRDVWKNHTPQEPVRVRRAQGTQLADAYRRLAERYKSLGRLETAIEALRQSIQTVDEAIHECGVDGRLSECGIEALRELLGTSYGSDDKPKLPTEVQNVVAGWDEDVRFVQAARGRSAALRHFKAAESLGITEYMPKTWQSLLSGAGEDRLIGTVVSKRNRFGFVHTERGNVHFDRGSLVAPRQWDEIQPGVIVMTNVITQKSGTHAIHLETLFDQISLEFEES